METVSLDSIKIGEGKKSSVSHYHFPPLQVPRCQKSVRVALIFKLTKIPGFNSVRFWRTKGVGRVSEPICHF